MSVINVYCYVQVIGEKEKMVSELSEKVATLESSLGEARERCGAAETQMEELKKELQDVEVVLHANDDEVTSMQEQLTEVCVCVCLCVCVCVCVVTGV